MDGIILINKEQGKTSRDIVNQVSRKLNIKKVGHAGTLDPLAKGLLVIGIGKGTKILDLLTLDKKEYIAVVKMGIKTDTFDITGTILEENYNFKITKEKLKEVLLSFKGSYEQEVPKYSAVKINGKRLYEYARNDLKVKLPKRLVNIYSIELINYDQDVQEFTFKVLVSKGTYIRSLINDIGKKLNINMTMKDLTRIKSGKFSLNNSSLITDNLQVIPLKEALDFEVVTITDEKLLKKIKNGNSIKLLNKNKFITLIDNSGKEMAIYKKDNFTYKPFKVF